MVRLGRLRLARLRDPRGALDIFEDVLRRKQGHAGAIGALEEMARSRQPAPRRGGRGARAHLHLRRRPPAAGADARVARLDRAGGRGARGAAPQGGQALRRADAERRAGLRLGEPGAARAPGRGGLAHAGGHPGRAGQPAAARSWPRCWRRSSPGPRRTPPGWPSSARWAGPRRRSGTRRRPSTPGGGCWRSSPPTARRWASLVRLYQAGRPRPRAAGDLPAAARDQRGAGGPRRAALPDRRAPGRRAPRHRRRHGHAPAPAGAEAGRRPGPGEARRALPEAGALAGAGGRHRPAAGAARRGPRPRPPDAAGGGPRDAAPRQVRRARAVRGRSSPPSRSTRAPSAQLEAWAQREPQNKPLVDVLLARVPRRRRAGEARAAARAPGRRLAGPVRAQGSSWSSWPACARRRDDPAGLFGALARAFQEDPNDAALRAAPGQGRPTRRAGPRGAGRSSTRRSSRASPRRRTPRQVLLELGDAVRAAPVEPRPGHRGPGAGAHARRRRPRSPRSPALARLYGQAGRSDRLVQSLDELEKLTPDVNERVQILFRLGQVAQDELEDEPARRGRLRAAAGARQDAPPGGPAARVHLRAQRHAGPAVQRAPHPARPDLRGRSGSASWPRW